MQRDATGRGRATTQRKVLTAAPVFYLPRIVPGVLAPPFPRHVHLLGVHRAVDQAVVHPEPLEVVEREHERRQHVPFREAELYLHVWVGLQEFVVVQELGQRQKATDVTLTLLDGGGEGGNGAPWAAIPA